MSAYEATVDTLAGELNRVEAAFRGLTGPEWAVSTQLVPVQEDLPRWTVFELARHFDISIGLTAMLLDGRGDLQPARDRARSGRAEPVAQSCTCSGLPASSRCASPIASDWVGCGWISWATSLGNASQL